MKATIMAPFYKTIIIVVSKFTIQALLAFSYPKFTNYSVFYACLGETVQAGVRGSSEGCYRSQLTSQSLHVNMLE